MLYVAESRGVTKGWKNVNCLDFYIFKKFVKVKVVFPIPDGSNVFYHFGILVGEDKTPETILVALV